METKDSQVKLSVTECEKDLGVNVNRYLKFSNHAEIVPNKENWLCGMIRCSFSYRDGEDMFNSLFKGLVRPHLEYGNTVWSLWYVKDVQLVENVQRRASKLVKGLKDLDYEERLRQLKLLSLLYRRQRGDLIQVYKYSHNHYDTKTLFHIDEGSRTRGHNLKNIKENCRKDVRKRFFSLRINSLWNNIPSHVVNADTLNSFKKHLDILFGDMKYPCSKEDIFSIVLS